MVSVSDRLDILELYSRYIHTLNHCEAEGWANCFAEDGIFNRPQGSDVAGVAATRVVGRAALAQLARSAYAEGQGRRRRWSGNVEITTGDRENEATGRATFMLLIASGPEPARIAVTGMFNDRLVRTKEGWRLGERTLTLDVGPS